MQFQVGEVVQLKSGSPKMTVRYINPTEGKISCTWFVQGQGVQRDTFPAEALER